METSTGSTINRIIGMGERVDPETGKTDSFVNFYPSWYRHVVKSFEVYPIYKHFGLTVSDAMALPVDEWIYIRKCAEKMLENQPPDTETMLLKVLKEFTSITRGGEE